MKTNAIIINLKLVLLILLLIMSFISFNAQAQSASNENSEKFCSSVSNLVDTFEKPDRGWSLYIDQDLFGADSIIDKNEDRDYTMGLEYAAAGARITTSPIFKYPNCLLEKFVVNYSLVPSDLYPFGRRSHVGSVGFTAFTPNDLAQPNPIVSDRPYANLLYLAVSELWVSDDVRRAINNKLIIGVLGLNFGEVLQTKIHELTDNTIPQGWGNQISDGGEITALFHRDDKRLIYSYSDKDWGLPELSLQWEGNLGYYTDIAGGFLIRWGNIHTPFYTHTSNPLSAVNHAKLDNGEVEKEFYFFVNGGLRLVGYNALLQGQFRDSVVSIPASDLERVLGEASLGFTWGFKTFKLTYSLNYRSSEFKTGLGDREHFFGGIYLQFYPD